MLLSFATHATVFSQSFTKITASPVVSRPGDSRSVNWIDINND